MKTKKWTTNDQLIAYYFAKYDGVGLNISEEEFSDTIIGTSTQSLKMQIANFRYLLNLEGYKLSHASRLQKEVIDRFDCLSQAGVKRIILTYVDKVDSQNVIRTNKDLNKKANKRRDELNAQYLQNFQNKLDAWRRMGRRLTPKLA